MNTTFLPSLVIGPSKSDSFLTSVSEFKSINRNLPSRFLDPIQSKRWKSQNDALFISNMTNPTASDRRQYIA